MNFDKEEICEKKSKPQMKHISCILRNSCKGEKSLLFALGHGVIISIHQR